jgi:Zn-finger nucleic acid-binding protein
MADAMSRFLCPGCNKRLKAPPVAAGRTVNCPKCGMAIIVPGSTKDTPEPSPPQESEAEKLQNESANGHWITRLNPVLLVGLSILLAVCIILGIIVATKVGQATVFGCGGLLVGAVILGIIHYVQNQRRTEKLYLEDQARTEKLYLQDQARKEQSQLLFEQGHHISRVAALLAAKEQELRKAVQQFFLVEPCVRCDEFTMLLTEISPNGRSITYQCLHCKKMSHAPAGSPKAHGVVELRSELDKLLAEYAACAAKYSQAHDDYHGKANSLFINLELIGLPPEIVFESPAGPLPYEQTTRSPTGDPCRTDS